MSEPAAEWVEIINAAVKRLTLGPVSFTGAVEEHHFPQSDSLPIKPSLLCN